MKANSTGKTQRFIEDAWFEETAEGPRLVGSRCESCRAVFFPKKQVCPKCFDGELRDVPLSRVGKLHSYALSVLGPPGIEKPFVVGFVDLPEGIKLYSILTDCDPWDDVLRIGMEMEMVVEKIKEDEQGLDIMGYKFRPSGRERT